MAERKLDVSLVIGGKIAPTVARAFRGVERQGKRTSSAIALAMKKAQLGEQLSGDVLKYRDALIKLKAEQAMLGNSSAKVARKIADVEAHYQSAKQKAQAYGISLDKLAQEHRELADAARLSERQLARHDAFERNRQVRSQVKGDFLSAAAPAFLLAQPIKQAIAFESAMADVNKVLNLKAPKALNEMRQAILSLATDKRIPLLPGQLAEIVTAFGREGLDKDLLLPFAQDAAKVAVAFDVTGEVAAKSLNRLRRTFGTSREGTMRIADAINVLDNKTAATAAGILNFNNRAAASGKAAGLTAQQISALGAAFITVGNEIAAHAVNSVLVRLQNADRQTPKFKRALRELGLGARELADHFKADANGALLGFLHAVKQSESASGLLFEMLGEGFSDDFLKLAQNVGELEKALGLLKDQTKVTGAVQDEYDTRSNTRANDLILLKNEVIKLAIVAGNVMLPTLQDVVSVLGSGLSVVSGLAERFPTLTKVIGLTTAAVVGLRLATLGGRFAGTLLSDTWLGVGKMMDKVAPTFLTRTREITQAQKAALAGAGSFQAKAALAGPLLITSLKDIATTAIPLLSTSVKGMAAKAGPLLIGSLKGMGLAAAALLSPVGFDPRCNPAPFDAALYQRLDRLLAHNVPVRSHYCIYLDVKAAAPLALAPAAAAVQKHRQSFCIDTPPLASTRTLAVGGVTTLVQSPERRALCLETPSGRRQTQVGLAALVRPVQVIRLALEL